MESLELGSASIASWSPSCPKMALTRRTTNTGWPRHTTFNICPASSLDASTSTGAPSALARALGCHDAKKGTAANATPIAPVPTVAAVNKRRRLWSTSSFISVSQRILGAHYTQIKWLSFKARGAILIAEHSRAVEFFAESGGGRTRRGVSSSLVEARAPGKGRHSGAIDAGRGAPPNRRHAKLRRCGGARGARRSQYLHRARCHRTHPGTRTQSVVRRFLAELSAARRTQPGIGGHRRHRRHHRDESARHRGCGIDPSAAQRRSHHRTDHCRAGSRHGHCHSASGHARAAHHARGPFGYVARGRC